MANSNTKKGNNKKAGKFSNPETMDSKEIRKQLSKDYFSIRPPYGKQKEINK